MTLSNIIGDMHKRALENARGRIFFYPGHWEWADNPPDEVVERHRANPDRATYSEKSDSAPSGFILYKYNAEHQRFYRLVHGPAVHCPHPKWTDDDWVPIKNSHSVLSRLCKRCEFYRKSGSVNRKIRYPTCAYRAKDSPERHAAQVTLDAFTGAVDRARDILE